MSKLKVGRVVWIGVMVRDMEAQARFYNEVVGIDVIERGDGWAHLDLGGGHLLELMELPKGSRSEKKGFRPGFQVRDIEAAREELISRGAKATGDIEGGPEMGGYWCYFKDAEGNDFELKQLIRPASKKRGAKKSGDKKSGGKKARKGR